MALNEYTVGQRVRVTGTFSVSGSPTDPTTVTLIVRQPNDQLVTYLTPTHQGLGVYYQDVTVTAEGRWIYRWVGTGTCVSASETPFVALKQEVGP